MRDHFDNAGRGARGSHVERADGAQSDRRRHQNRVCQVRQRELGAVFGGSGDFEARVLARGALADEGLHELKVAVAARAASEADVTL